MVTEKVERLLRLGGLGRTEKTVQIKTADVASAQKTSVTFNRVVDFELNVFDPADTCVDAAIRLQIQPAVSRRAAIHGEIVRQTRRSKRSPSDDYFATLHTVSPLSK